jgi:hypothetical protein
MENQTKDAVETVRNYQGNGHNVEVLPTDQPNGDRLSTLAELARALGPEIASLVEMPEGDQLTVSNVVFYDRSAPVAPDPGAITLAIGFPLVGEHLPTLFAELKTAGFAALVYKSHGATDVELREAARSAGIALFRAADEVPWANSRKSSVPPRCRGGTRECRWRTSGPAICSSSRMLSRPWRAAPSPWSIPTRTCSPIPPCPGSP